MHRNAHYSNESKDFQIRGIRIILRNIDQLKDMQNIYIVILADILGQKKDIKLFFNDNLRKEHYTTEYIYRRQIYY